MSNGVDWKVMYLAHQRTCKRPIVMCETSMGATAVLEDQLAEADMKAAEEIVELERQLESVSQTALSLNDDNRNTIARLEKERDEYKAAYYASESKQRGLEKAVAELTEQIGNLELSTAKAWGEVDTLKQQLKKPHD